MKKAEGRSWGDAINIKGSERRKRGDARMRRGIWDKEQSLVLSPLAAADADDCDQVPFDKLHKNDASSVCKSLKTEK